MHDRRPSSTGDSFDDLRTDLALAARERNGMRSLDSLFARYVPLVSMLVRRQVSESEVHDVTQDVLLRAVERIDQFTYRGPGSFAGWLTRIVCSQVVDHHRRARARRMPVERSAPVEELIAVDETPSRAVDVKQRLARRRDAVARLDKRARQIVTLREEGEYLFQQIAETVGLPSADAARMAYRRAIAEVEMKLDSA